MKTILANLFICLMLACHNPEEKATTITDTNATYNEGAVTNSPPGPTTPDTSNNNGLIAPGDTLDTTNKP